MQRSCFGHERESNYLGMGHYLGDFFNIGMAENRDRSSFHSY